MAVDRSDVVSGSGFVGRWLGLLGDDVAGENGAGALPVGAAGADAVVKVDGVGTVGAFDHGETVRGETGESGGDVANFEMIRGGGKKGLHCACVVLCRAGVLGS